MQGLKFSLETGDELDTAENSENAVIDVYDSGCPKKRNSINRNVPWWNNKELAKLGNEVRRLLE